MTVNELFQLGAGRVGSVDMEEGNEGVFVVLGDYNEVTGGVMERKGFLYNNEAVFGEGAAGHVSSNSFHSLFLSVHWLTSSKVTIHNVEIFAGGLDCFPCGR